MIQFVSGDLLRATTQYIGQGVATGSQEGLGTGLALKISQAWPDAQQAFKRHTRNHTFDGGDLFVVAPTSERPGLIYLATQPDMYHATQPFLNKALRKLAKYCTNNEVQSVGLPKIGAGLGKLSWETDVKPLMTQHLTAPETLFLAYEDFKTQYEIGGRQ